MARPRALPESEALERALLLFWEKGYDRTSINDLGAVLGVGPSSIYNAFGSKAELFRKTLDHYSNTHAGFVPGIVGGTAAKGLVPSLRELLRGAARLYTTNELPPGCAILQGGGAGGSDDSDGGCISKEFRQGLEGALRSMFDAANGEVELAATPRVLAKFMLGTMRGLSQLACDGTSRKELFAIADHAVSSCVLPTHP